MLSLCVLLAEKYVTIHKAVLVLKTNTVTNNSNHTNNFQKTVQDYNLYEVRK